MTSKNNYKAWIYLAPSLILLIVFALYPLIDTFIISFLKDYNYINGKNNGLTLDNYKVLFQIIPPTFNATPNNTGTAKCILLWQYL